MYTASERIRHVHAHLQRIPHVLDHTPALEQLMLSLRHQPLHVVSRRNVQPFLRFEESGQFVLLQQISCITHEDSLEVYDQVSQPPVIMHVTRGEKDVLQIPLAVAYPMQLESVEPALRRLPSSSYLFCYAIVIYIVVLAYRYIRRIYKMLLIAKAVPMEHILHQQADEQPRTVRRLQKVLVIRQLRKIPLVVHSNDPMKRLQILHSHVESQQIQRHHLRQGKLLLPTPFVFPKVSKFLAKGSMKKSLKKVINKGKKKSKFVSTHIQPPWIWCSLKHFLSYLQEVVNLSIH